MSDDENNHEPTDTRMRFDQLALSQPILKAVQKAGYENPSPIRNAPFRLYLKVRTLLAWPRLEPERPRLLHSPS
jgi:superfamily II DNA/RNA helicase